MGSEDINSSVSDNKCIGSLLWVNPQGAYLYGELGGPVMMSERLPPNCPVYTEYTVT
jgi:hypothetical protein